MSTAIDKVLSIAKAEIGYLEKKSNTKLDSKTENSGSNNYTKYWRDMCPSMNGNAWCNCFSNWCFVKAFGDSMAKKVLCSTSGWSYYTPTSAGYFKKAGKWYSKPQVGDIIYFKNSTRICHVGIVYKVDSSKVYTYEGNTSSGSNVIANGGSVCAKSYALNNSRIAGYGRPKYELVEPTKEKTDCPYIEPMQTLKEKSSGEGVKWMKWHLNKLIDMGKIKGSKLSETNPNWLLSTSDVFKAFQIKYPETGDKNGKPDGMLGKKARDVMKKEVK